MRLKLSCFVPLKARQKRLPCTVQIQLKLWRFGICLSASVTESGYAQGKLEGRQRSCRDGERAKTNCTSGSCSGGGSQD